MEAHGWVEVMFWGDVLVCLWLHTESVFWGVFRDFGCVLGLIWDFWVLFWLGVFWGWCSGGCVLGFVFWGCVLGLHACGSPKHSQSTVSKRECFGLPHVWVPKDLSGD